jgi:hypothetical protein
MLKVVNSIKSTNDTRRTTHGKKRRGEGEKRRKGEPVEIASVLLHALSVSVVFI